MTVSGATYSDGVPSPYPIVVADRGNGAFVLRYALVPTSGPDDEPWGCDECGCDLAPGMPLWFFSEVSVVCLPCGMSEVTAYRAGTHADVERWDDITLRV